MKSILRSFTRFLNRIASVKSLLFLALLYVIFPAYLLKHAEQKINSLAGREIGIIDLTFGFHPARTLQMVADYGTEARAYYARTEMTTDLVYPIVYAFLFGIILSLLYRHTVYDWINIFPFVVMLADFVENMHIVILLRHYPQQSVDTAAMLEVVKLFKWSSFAIMILLVMVGLAGKIRGLKKHKIS